MNIVYVQDRGGNSLKLQIFENTYHIPFYKPTALRGIRSFALREDDIYFPSYLRTGTHWTFEMISMLLNGNAETIHGSKAKFHLETADSEDFSTRPSPRVIAAHMCLSGAPEQLTEKKCKIVYKLRDPKDVAVSLYHFYLGFPAILDYRGQFKDFLYLFLDGKVDGNGIFEHYRDAENFFADNPDIPVHIQVYEEAVKNPVLEIQKLSDFLGLKRDDKLCQAIAEKCTFSRVKKDKDANASKHNFKDVLYRKGTVGDWKNYFTEEMLDDYYRVYDEKMKGSRFYDRYARDKYM